MKQNDSSLKTEEEKKKEWKEDMDADRKAIHRQAMIGKYPPPEDDYDYDEILSSSTSFVGSEVDISNFPCPDLHCGGTLRQAEESWKCDTCGLVVSSFQEWQEKMRDPGGAHRRFTSFLAQFGFAA